MSRRALKLTPAERRCLLDAEANPTLTTAQAQDIYGVSETTLLSAIRRGEVPSIRLGLRRIVIPTAAVRRQLGLDPDDETATSSTRQRPGACPHPAADSLLGSTADGTAP